MRRIAIGGITGLGLWLASAMAADAQASVDPSGPTAVTVIDATSLYTATVTCNYSFWFKLNVYHGGISKHMSNTYCLNSGPSYAFSKLVQFMDSWGMQVGDVLDYVGRATIAIGPYKNFYDEEHWYVTVLNYYGLILPGRERIRERVGVELA